MSHLAVSKAHGTKASHGEVASVSEAAGPVDRSAFMRLIGAAQVIVYIGAISVLILFAIMLTQTKDAPARLVFQTQAGAAAIASVRAMTAGSGA